MKGMRIKNHKNSYPNQNYRNEQYVRYTPIGAIRLLPPMPVQPTTNITLVPRPASANLSIKTKAAKATRTGSTAKKGHAVKVAAKRTAKRK